jgi:hypothetical protein
VDCGLWIADDGGMNCPFHNSCKLEAKQNQPISEISTKIYLR